MLFRTGLYVKSGCITLSASGEVDPKNEPESTCCMAASREEILKLCSPLSLPDAEKTEMLQKRYLGIPVGNVCFTTKNTSIGSKTSEVTTQHCDVRQK